MRNRPPSTPLQLLTIVALGAAWALSKVFRNGGNPAAVYHVSSARCTMLSAVAFAADVYAIPAILRSKPAISSEETDHLQPARIFRLDQVALHLPTERREAIRSASDDVLKVIIALPVLLLLHKPFRRDAAVLAALYVWMHAATYTIYSYSPLGPAFVDRYRPVVYYQTVPQSERRKGNNRNSTYSGHTGNAACASFFMAKVWCDYHPEMTAIAKAALYLAASLPPLLLGAMRVRALKHFPSDVLLATMIGGTCGVLIPEAHRIAR